jgi:diguanylate cyclase (GGDEF)-like protein
VPAPSLSQLLYESGALTRHYGDSATNRRMARTANRSIIAAMPERPVPFSLLDAARVVARGGTFDAKLEALSSQARTVAGGGPVAMLLHDADADVLLTLDGEVALPISAADADLARVVADRSPELIDAVPEGLGTVLPGARSCLLSPLVVEDEEGAFLEGILVIGWDSEAAPLEIVPDAILAISDLAAVTVRQARLRNSAWEQSDHADRLLHTDRLTGLANRVTFERMLELEIARATRQGSPLAVAVLDVDGLGDIGDRQGARVADEVLRHVASAIADRVRLLDTVARFGQDEFVVIAPGDAGGIVALRLRDAIAELPPIGEVDISVSAAVVHHPADGATGSELVAASETALARAKSSGPGTVFGVQEATA